MWIVAAWSLAGVLALSFMAKVYSRVVTFRQYAHQVIREVQVSIDVKDWVVAEQLIEPLLKKRRYRKLYIYDYIRILRGMKRFREVDENLAWANRQGLHDYRYCLEVGYREYRRGNFKGSAQAFSKIRQDLMKEEDVAKYASALVYLGELEYACSLMEPLVSPLSPQETFIALGHIYFASKRYGDAVEFYSRASALGDLTLDITYNFAHSLRLTADYRRSIKLFESLLQEPFYRDEALFNIGLCEQKMGNARKALEVYQNSFLWNRGDALLMRYAADAAMSSDDYILAERCWRLALRNPAYSSNSEYCAKLGVCLSKQGKYQEAEKIFLNAAAYCPDDLLSLKALAWLFGVGISSYISNEEGLAYARKAVALVRNEVTLELLSVCEARAGNFSVAYEIQSYLSSLDSSAQQKQKRSEIMRNLRKRLPLSNLHIMEFNELLAA